MSKEQFVERWKRHVAGVIALGGNNVRRILARQLVEAAQSQEPEQLGAVVVDTHAETVKLLGQLYDSLNPPPKAA